MAKANAIISTVLEIEPSLEHAAAHRARDVPVSATLADGTRVQLDPGDEKSPGRAQVLDGLRRHRLPAYFEVDPETSTVTTLLIPHVTRVTELSPRGDEGIEVQLERSH